MSGASGEAEVALSPALCVCPAGSPRWWYKPPQTQPDSPSTRGCRLSGHGTGICSAQPPPGTTELPGEGLQRERRPAAHLTLISHTVSAAVGPPGPEEILSFAQVLGDAACLEQLGVGALPGVRGWGWGKAASRSGGWAGLGAPCLKRGRQGLLSRTTWPELAPSHRRPAGGTCVGIAGEATHLQGRDDLP